MSVKKDLLVLAKRCFLKERCAMALFGGKRSESIRDVAHVGMESES